MAELLKLVGLPDSGGKYPGQLSGGQQQRIALARALASAPGLLLLDEPLSALDALERLRLRGEIRALQQRLGVTTILVTHDQEEALSMADRIVVMNQGRIEQVGTPREVYETPATPFAADFIGKVNVLPGVAEAAGRVRVGGIALAVGALRSRRRRAGADLPAAGGRQRPRRRQRCRRARRTRCRPASPRSSSSARSASSASRSPPPARRRWSPTCRARRSTPAASTPAPP